MDLLSLTRAVRVFTWFLSQSLNVGGLGYQFFLVPFLLLAIGLVVAWKFASLDRRRLWVLLILPAFWILTGLLGGFYWKDFSHVPPQNPPQWVIFMLTFNFVSFPLVGLTTVFLLKGARWFAGISIFMNLYFMITMTLLSGMAISGDWL
jgi:hypothetical protein